MAEAWADWTQSLQRWSLAKIVPRSIRVCLMCRPYQDMETHT